MSRSWISTTILLVVLVATLWTGCAHRLVPDLEQSANSWLDAYFERYRAYHAEHTAVLVSEGLYTPAAAEASAALTERDIALRRYIFLYYLAQEPSKLDWYDGDWGLNVMPCNCGEHGSLPSKEFDRRFKAYGNAYMGYHEAIGGWKGEQILQQTLWSRPDLKAPDIAPRMQHLREGFEALKEVAGRGRASEFGAPRRRPRPISPLTAVNLISDS